MLSNMYTFSKLTVIVFETVWFTMFITAVCFILIKIRWPKNKSLYNHAAISKHSPPHKQRMVSLCMKQTNEPHTIYFTNNKDGTLSSCVLVP